MNIFKKYSAILGGANVSVLSDCPIEDHNKWASAGIMNLLTSGIFGAMIANAFLGVFGESIKPYSLIFIGLFFTSISFVITYALSGTMKNSKKGLARFAALVPRLAISIVFSMLTTGVLATLVFGTFLPHGRRLLELNSANTSNNLISSSMFDEQLRLRNVRTELDKDINELITLNTELILNDPSVIHAIEERDNLNNRLNTLTTQHRDANLAANNRIAATRRNISAINNEIESLQNQLQTENIQRNIQDLNASIVAHNSMINNESRAIDSRNTELSNMQHQLNVLKEQLQQRMLAIDSQNRVRITALTHQRDITETEYREIGALIAAETEKNRHGAEQAFSSGLIANLVALEYLMSFRNDLSAPFEDQQVGKMVFATFIILMLATILLDISPILILLIHGNDGLYEFKILTSMETKKKEENLDNESIVFRKELDVKKVMKESKMQSEEVLLKAEAETRTQRVINELKDLIDKTALINEHQRNAFTVANEQLKPVDDTSASNWADIACSIFETYISTHKNVAEQFLEKVYAEHHAQTMGYVYEPLTVEI